MLLEDILSEVIEDYRNKPAKKTRRLIKINKIPGRASTIIGLRRSGKTSFLLQEMHDLMQKNKVSTEQILFINFEDDRLDLENPDLLKKIFDVFYKKMGLNVHKEKYVFLDEIQAYPNWERFVRRIIDTENLHIYLTGSSSRLLSTEIATSMRGRSISTDFFPFSFTEFLMHNGCIIQEKNKLNKEMRAIYESYFLTYIQRTSFPELVNLEQSLCNIAIKDYLDVIILRDIVERYKVSSIHILRQLVKQAMCNSAKLFSVNKFYTDLKSRGLPLSKETCLNFLTYLEDSFAVFLVPQFFHSERKSQTQVKKVYAADIGFVHLFGMDKDNNGQLLETIVFLELRRHHLNICYYKTKNAKEIDFIFLYNGKTFFLQVCWSLESAETKKREISALIEASKECTNAEFVIVTAYDSDEINDSGVKIRIIPAWKWFLYDSPFA